MLTRWQYRLVSTTFGSSLERELNDLGSEGWELVAMAGLGGTATLTGNKFTAIMKRPAIAHDVEGNAFVLQATGPRDTARDVRDLAQRLGVEGLAATYPEVLPQILTVALARMGAGDVVDGEAVAWGCQRVVQLGEAADVALHRALLDQRQRNSGR